MLGLAENVCCIVPYRVTMITSFIKEEEYDMRYKKEGITDGQA
jgi:hypothetical protein